MWADLAIGFVLVSVTGLISVGFLYYLVTKDFFFPYFLNVARRIRKSGLLALTCAAAVFILTLISLSHWQITKTSPKVGWDIRSMWVSLSTPSRAFILILLALSFYSFCVMVDRALMYRAARKQSRIFVQQVSQALEDGNIDEAIAIAERNKKSHIAKVVATGLSEVQSASQQVSDSDVINEAKRGVERSIAIVHAEMKRGLSALATIGSTAPFVGLFGTVVGILNAFKGIETQKTTGLSAIAGGIAEALVTTAFGLLVAVPTVWAYNYFTNQVEAFDREMDKSSTDLITSLILRRHARK